MSLLATRPVLVGLVMLGALIVHAPAPAQQTNPAAATLPRLTELKQGWNSLAPGGRTSCAVTNDYRFFGRPGASDRLLVYFMGGGACWNGKDCDPAGAPTYQHVAGLPPEPLRGIFDTTQPQNPFAAYSMVVVSYCTGDVHLGDQDTTYIVQDERGSRQLTIHHRGQINAMSALRWIHANFTAPRQVVVVGGSAGAIATPFYASLLAQHYPHARVIGLADGGGALHVVGRPGPAAPTNWGMPEVLQRHRGWEQATGPGVVALNITAATTAPNLSLFHVDHAYDLAQRQRLALGGNPNADLLSLLRSANQAIHDEVPAFRSFILGGSNHLILHTPVFYSIMTGRHRLRDWVAAIVAGDTVPTVDCDDCRRPQYAYSATDVAIIERAIELLSAPGAWAPDPMQAPCATLGPGRYSLACGLWAAIREVTGDERTPGQYAPAAAWDVMFTVAERMAGTPVVNQVDLVALVRFYNNRPGITLAEILAVLHESRDRIRAGAGRE